MITQKNFNKYTDNLLDFNKYPAVEYKILKDFKNLDYNDEKLKKLRIEFLSSDIVAEMAECQDYDGHWGPFFSKDYSKKDKIPTTSVGIERCLYIGLSKVDNDILFVINDWLENVFDDKIAYDYYEKNERALHSQRYRFAECLESITPNTEIIDSLYDKWLYIADEAFKSGEYSYDDDKNIQHQLLGTHQQRLSYMPVKLLTMRKNNLPVELNDKMRDYYAKHAAENGHFWDKNLYEFPENFTNPKTSRWFHTLNYVNMFRNTEKYMQTALEWLENVQNSDNLWDYGTQTKDPWGYFKYFSLTKNHKYNRIINCTIEVLTVFKQYLDNNEKP